MLNNKIEQPRHYIQPREGCYVFGFGPTSPQTRLLFPAYRRIGLEVENIQTSMHLAFRE